MMINLQINKKIINNFHDLFNNFVKLLKSQIKSKKRTQGCRFSDQVLN